MNFVEVLRGIGNVAFVMAIAGAVAYVGDRVGHQVGRKRLTLYGIRPRYTSTIVAIATGMIIALAVTLIAILASNEVKTAFFKLNSLNTQIAQLQSQQQELEAKVNEGQLVLPVGSLMVPFYRPISRNATQDERFAQIKAFYDDAVKYVNANYQRIGLKPYQKPKDADKKLRQYSDNLDGALSRSDVLLTILAGQNLFLNDEIHFEINATPDVRFYAKSQPIAQVTINGNSGANMNLAIYQLLNYVSLGAKRLTLPSFLADNVRPTGVIPDLAQMQQMVNKPGNYVLTAFAAEDFYPHIGGIPVVVVLTPQP